MSMNDDELAPTEDCDGDCVPHKVSPRHSQACYGRFAQRRLRPVTPPGGPVSPPRDRIQERIDYYREKYFGRDKDEVMVLIAIEEANRILSEGAGQRASEIVEGYEALRDAQGQPIVRRGDVLLTLGHEIAAAGHQLKSAAEWQERAVTFLRRLTDRTEHAAQCDSLCVKCGAQKLLAEVAP